MYAKSIYSRHDSCRRDWYHGTSRDTLRVPTLPLRKHSHYFIYNNNGDSVLHKSAFCLARPRYWRRELFVALFAELKSHKIERFYALFVVIDLSTG